MTLVELYRELDAIQAPSWTRGAPFNDAPRVLRAVVERLVTYDASLKSATERLLALDEAALNATLQAFFAGERGDWSEPEALALLATLRAYARHLAQETEGEDARCPVCGGTTDVAYLDEEGFRHLVCGVCDSRWTVPRIGCPYCGETDHKKLRYYPYDPHYRLYECQTCGATLPAVDLRQAGRLDLPALRAAGVEMRALLASDQVEG